MGLQVIGILLLGVSKVRAFDGQIRPPISSSQMTVGIIALAAGFRSTVPSFPEANVFPTGFFAALWLLSAYLFLKAAREVAI